MMEPGKTNGTTHDREHFKIPVVDVSVALSPNDLKSVPEIVKAIDSLTDKAISGDDDARIALVDKSRSLVQALETPRETMIKHVWAQPAASSSLTVAINLGVFSGSLALLLSPLLCNLNRCDPEIEGGIINAMKFPEWARKNNYINPITAPGPLQYAYQTDLNAFEVLMVAGHLGWIRASFYPVEDRLIKGAEKDGPVLVDIGGGVGHDLDEFRRKIPNIPGRLILEDLPQVVTQSVLDDGIEKVPYDFFHEQPIKGARAYYLHSVLHDWLGDSAVQILANVKAAMKSGYLRLLINEHALPAQGAQWEATALDIMMMSFFAALERTEADWRLLLEDKTGLRITGIYTFENGVESIVEAELV